MANLITLEMYTARLGRGPLTATRQAQVEAYLTDASALVRRIAEGALDDIDAPAALVPVVFSMVRRGIDNPRGLTSEQLGDYKWASPGQSLYATPEEVALIQSISEVNLIREVTLTGDIPDRLLLDSDSVLGRAGFEYSDL